MRELKQLFDNNKAWAAKIREEDPEFFSKLSEMQSPEYLWIGCADSRVPANEVVGMLPGSLFVHRNVANVVAHTDFNCLSVVQYAVDILKVRHIVVCGHYGCGGVRAAMEKQRYGLIDNWLRLVEDVHTKHREHVDAIADLDERHDRLCELNVIEQVLNICETTIVQDAWAREQRVSVHGFIYGLSDGMLHDMDICITGAEEVGEVYANAVDRLERQAA